MFSVLIKSSGKLKVNEAQVQKLAQKILEKFFHTDADIELSILIVNESRSRQINQEYRHLDESASILSFSLQEPSRTEQIQTLRKSAGRWTFANSPDGRLRLGDLVICPQVAKRKNLTLENLLEHGITSLFSQISASNNLRTGLGRNS